MEAKLEGGHWEGLKMRQWKWKTFNSVAKTNMWATWAYLSVSREEIGVADTKPYLSLCPIRRMQSERARLVGAGWMNELVNGNRFPALKIPELNVTESGLFHHSKIAETGGICLGMYDFGVHIWCKIFFDRRKILVLVYCVYQVIKCSKVCVQSFGVFYFKTRIK